MANDTDGQHDITVRIRHGIDPAQALRRVAEVIEAGLVTDQTGKQHYRWLTTWPNGDSVIFSEFPRLSDRFFTVVNNRKASQACER